VSSVDVRNVQGGKGGLTSLPNGRRWDYPIVSSSTRFSYGESGLTDRSSDGITDFGRQEHDSSGNCHV
jgi:hypothetical protein